MYALLCTILSKVVLFIQVWNLTNCKLKTNHFGHSAYLNCVTISPDGSLYASRGKVRNNFSHGLACHSRMSGSVWRGSGREEGREERGGVDGRGWRERGVGKAGGSICMSKKLSAVHSGKG